MEYALEPSPLNWDLGKHTQPLVDQFCKEIGPVVTKVPRTRKTTATEFALWSSPGGLPHLSEKLARCVNSH
eukprot:476486-Amphidinium_carterae.1